MHTVSSYGFMHRLGMSAIVAAVALATIDARALRPDSPAADQEPQKDVVDLTIKTTGAQTRYAVPDFVAINPDAAAEGKTLAQVLFDDLAFEREFYLIPRDTSASIGAPRPGAEFPFKTWLELGADGVVAGTVQKTGESLHVDVRLYDVRRQQPVFSAGYDGTARSVRQIAHTISDAIHLQQAKLRGVARTKLAFISDRDRERVDGTFEKREVKHVYIVDYDGFNPRRITVNRYLNLTPSWSPDGRTLAYTAYSPSGADIVLSRIYEGLPLQRPAKGIGNNYLPVFSPDGTRIAFMSYRDGQGEIYVMNVDGSNLRRLTNHPADDVTPTWSPSGTQIAFTSARSGRPLIYTMNSADGSGVKLITPDESEADRPTWSPAPYNEIAFTARTGNWYDIKVYDVATGRIRTLTDGKGSNESPAFSPTGRHLAFTSTRTGSSQIFTIGRDGNGLKQISREGNNQTAAWSSN